jgi:hypothetical protein
MTLKQYHLFMYRCFFPILEDVLDWLLLLLIAIYISEYIDSISAQTSLIGNAKTATPFHNNIILFIFHLWFVSSCLIGV